MEQSNKAPKKDSDEISESPEKIITFTEWVRTQLLHLSANVIVGVVLIGITFLSEYLISIITPDIRVIRPFSKIAMLFVIIIEVVPLLLVVYSGIKFQYIRRRNQQKELIVRLQQREVELYRRLKFDIASLISEKQTSDVR